ncbi:MAG: dihydrofolate reductase, partial [Chthoniobacterales bacterium]
MIAVAAMAANRVIGADGKIPWHLPEDLRWFKELTMGGTLLMGRVTYDSIGKPLPGRKTIVMSRREGLAIPGVQVIRDLSGLQSIEIQGEVFVVGGSEVYR